METPLVTWALRVRSTCLVALILALMQPIAWGQRQILGPSPGVYMKGESGTAASHAQTLVPVPSDVIERYGDFARYSPTRLSSASGFALEAETLARLQDRAAITGRGDDILYFATASLKEGDPRVKPGRLALGQASPADIIGVDRRTGKVLEQYQCKARVKATKQALGNPKYDGMTIVTTKENAKAIQDQLEKKSRDYLRRGISPFPKEHQLSLRRMKMLTNTLPPGGGGQYLPTNNRILTLAEKTLARSWDKLARVGGRVGLPVSAFRTASDTIPLAKRAGRVVDLADTWRDRNRVSHFSAILGFSNGGERTTQITRRSRKSPDPRSLRVSPSGKSRSALGTFGDSAGLGRTLGHVAAPAEAALAAYTAYRAYEKWSSGTSNDAFVAMKVTSAGMEICLALWLAPEPVFTKAVAVLTTVAVLIDLTADKLDAADRASRERLYGLLESAERFTLADNDLRARHLRLSSSSSK